MRNEICATMKSVLLVAAALDFSAWTNVSEQIAGPYSLVSVSATAAPGVSLLHTSGSVAVPSSSGIPQRSGGSCNDLRVALASDARRLATARAERFASDLGVTLGPIVRNDPPASELAQRPDPYDPTSCGLPKFGRPPFGVSVQPSYAEGFAEVGQPGVGVYDFANADEVSAHELLHAVGLDHAPSCVSASNDVDPANSPTDGTLGTNAWGVNLSFPYKESDYYSPPTPDLMGYCSTRWIGIYSWTRASNLLATSTGNDTGSARRKSDEPINVSIYPYLLNIAGTTAPLSLLPAYTIADPGGMVPTTGANSISGYDSLGNLLFSQPFDSAPILDGSSSAPSFFLDIPLTASEATNLHSLTLTSPSGSLTVKSSAVGPPIASATTDGQTVTLTWNSLSYPTVECSGASTFVYGLIPTNPSLPLSSASFASTDSMLTCDFSDGVKSMPVSIDPVSANESAAVRKR